MEGIYEGSDKKGKGIYEGSDKKHLTVGEAREQTSGGHGPV